MRKNTILILTVALAFAALYLYVAADGRRLLFSAIPESAIVVFETNDARQLHRQLTQNASFADWRQFAVVGKLENAFGILDSLFLNPALPDARNLLASLHVTKADDYDYLLFTNPDALRMPLPDLIDSLSRRGIPSEIRTFKNSTIYELTLPQKKVFTIAQDGKIVVASAVPILVDEALTEYHRWFSGNYVQFAKELPSGNGGFTLHSNFSNLHLLETIFLKSGIQQSVFSALEQNFSGASFTIASRQNGFELSGKLSANKQLFILPILQQSCPPKVTIAGVVPNNTGFLLYNRANDVQKIARSKKGGLFSGSSNLNWAGKEWAFGFTEPASGNMADIAFAAIALSDSAQAAKAMRQLQPNTNAKPLIYKGYTLQPAAAQNMLQPLLGNSAAALFNNAWCTILNGYVLFTPTAEHLQVLIENYTARQTLATDKHYQHFEEGLYPESNTFVYILPEKLTQLIKATASQTFLQDFTQKNNYYRRFTPLAFQLQKSGNEIVTTGLIGYAPPNHPTNTQPNAETEATPATLLWSATLQDQAAQAPQLVTNFLNGEKELLVLDKSNKLYLISRNGKVLWNRQFEKPVLGQIQQIDFYNNGNLYFLFNTANRIYLLDRTGQDVQNYPIKLSSAAARGLLSVDFEGNKEYTYFVPCGNNNIYGYEQSGKPVPGWNPRQYLSLMAFDLQYFTYLNKQYLLTANTNGNIYLLAPNGQLEQKIVTGSPLVSPPQIALRDGKPKIAATARNSQTYVIAPDGAKWSKKYVHISPTADFFTANLQGNNNDEFVFMSNNKVYAFSDKKKLFEYAFSDSPHPVDIFPITVADEKYAYTGVYCENSRQIYLLNPLGENYPDFPLQASTPFIATDLLDNSGTVLIAGGIDNNVFAYKLK